MMNWILYMQNIEGMVFMLITLINMLIIHDNLCI